MKEQNTGFRKELIIWISIGLFLLSIIFSKVKLYFSIPSALICFFFEMHALANRKNSKRCKFIFSVFSPFCFLFLHFWFLYLCKDISNIVANVRSSYIVAIVIITVLNVWYSSLIHEEVGTGPASILHSDVSSLHTVPDDTSSSNPIQTELHSTPHKPSWKELYAPSTEPVQEAHERLTMYNDKFDYMTGADFEEYCADLLRRNGFVDVSVTSASGDFGADILATQNQVKYAIQCKCYSSDIGIDAVYQISGGMKYYGANIGVVLTNRYFTRQAEELANKIGIILWDRDFLLSLIDSRSEHISVTTDPLQESEKDIYFEEAGKFIIDKEKASIGMLQRMFKIGFNRATRIMDQLYDAGVIGPEEGINPRKVLMTMEEFQNYIDTHN